MNHRYYENVQVFNVLQPRPSLPQACIAIPTACLAYYQIFLLLGSNTPLAALTIGGLMFLASLPNLGLNLPYTQWVHELLVLSGEYYRDGTHLCFEFELTSDLPVGVWCYHPHGMFSWYMGANHLRHSLPSTSRLQSDVGFNADSKGQHLCPSILPRQGLAVRVLVDSPLFRHFIVDMIRSTWPADKKGMAQLMNAADSGKRREAVALIPGGFHEASVCTRGKHRVYVKEKKGFVKTALRAGYALYPCYVFGESETYTNPQGMLKQRLWLAKANVPTILPFGEWFCPMLPRRDLGLYTVVGPPIRCPHLPDPCQADIDKWHQLYVEGLVSLFNRNKALFGYAGEELEVF